MWTNVPEDNNDLRDEESTVDEGEIKYIAEEYYTEKIIKFASDYVGKIIYERLKDSIIRRLQAEVEACITGGKNINNAYFGCYFEQIVHRIFRKGGSFRVHSLEPDSNDNLLKSKTFPSIDAIVAPDKLFQITIATNHPIKKVMWQLPKAEFVTSKDDVSRRLPRWIKDHVKQYVLGIDLSSGGSGNLPRTSSTATIEAIYQLLKSHRLLM
ncbi:hypothetical protein C1646_773452 [Rhizophagus diaphanus]|nr:hypothetical protein C1646_773452 [Rhizophagus diaphanus] [Rhizophagus sp. MUCL 43196]